MEEHPHVVEERWVPRFSLLILAAFFVAAVLLGVILLVTGAEPFAVGLSFFGALVMAVGAFLGFGPSSRSS